MENKEQQFLPHAKQSEFIEALGNLGYMFLILLWGRQTGKTSVLGYVIKNAAYALDGGSIAFVAPSLKRAKSLMWQRLMDHFVNKEAGIDSIIEIDKQIGMMRVKNKHGNSTKIQFYGWNGGQADTMRGETVDLVVMDEVDFYREFFSYFQEAVLPTISTTQGRIIFASSPKNKGNMYLLEKDAENDPTYYHSKAVCYDNPFSDKAVIAKAKKTSSDKSFRQEFLAEYVMVEGAVFDKYDEMVHIYGPEAHERNPNIPESVADKAVEKYVGVDFGYGGVKGRTAITYCYVLPDDTYWIEQEQYDTTMSPRRIAERIEPFDPTEVFPDPADKYRVQELMETGLPVREFIKMQGSRHSGLDRINNMFADKRLFIHEDCINTIAEIGSAEWKEMNVGCISDPDIDPKDADHAIDSLRYIIQNTDEYYNPLYETNPYEHSLVPIPRRQIVK